MSSFSTIYAPSDGEDLLPDDESVNVELRRRPQVKDDEDNDSLRLERRAHRIQAELQLSHIQQLAMEAERAAEAGETRFSHKPITFGSSTAEGVSPRRHSFAEGSRIIWRDPPQQPNSTPLLELRDAKEVFPSFGEFHKHLRTHFRDSDISMTTLVFEEVAPRSEVGRHHSSKSLIGDLKDTLTSWNVSGDYDADEANALPSYDESQGEEATSPLTGEILAGHLHDPNEKVVKNRVKAPPGLLPKATMRRSSSAVKPAVSFGPTAVSERPYMTEPMKRVKSDSSSVITTNQQRQDVQGLISPRALFDGSADEDDRSVEMPASNGTATPPGEPSTPTIERNRTSFSSTYEDGTFVTPARLRDIRRTSNTSPERASHPSLLLPTNSVLESPSLASPLLPVLASGQDICRNHAPNQGILLPELKNNDKGLDADRNANDASSKHSGVPIQPSWSNTSDVRSEASSPFRDDGNHDPQRQQPPKQHPKSNEAYLNMSHSSTVESMKILMRPKSIRGSLQRLSRRRLFYSKRDNAAFLKNFLYRGKSLQLQEDNGNTRCADRVGCTDALWTVCEPVFGGRKDSGPALDLNPSHSTADRSQTESWYDAANERLDGMMESIMRGVRPTRHWDTMFEAPALDKNHAPEKLSSVSRSGSVDPLEMSDSKSQDGNRLESQLTLDTVDEWIPQTPTLTNGKSLRSPKDEEEIYHANRQELFLGANDARNGSTSSENRSKLPRSDTPVKPLAGESPLNEAKVVKICKSI